MPFNENQARLDALYNLFAGNFVPGMQPRRVVSQGAPMGSPFNPQMTPPNPNFGTPPLAVPSGNLGSIMRLIQRLQGGRIGARMLPVGRVVKEGGIVRRLTPAELEYMDRMGSDALNFTSELSPEITHGNPVMAETDAYAGLERRTDIDRRVQQSIYDMIDDARTADRRKP